MKHHDKAFIELGHSAENRIYMSGEKRSVFQQGENENEEGRKGREK